MNKNQYLASLKAADSKNFKALKLIINLFSLKAKSWKKWENNLGDSINLFDDGQKINYTFSFNDINDLLQFAKIKDVLKISSILIGIKKKNIIKIWLLGTDQIIRLFEFDEEWKMKHLFSETPALTLHIMNMFLGLNDNFKNSFQIDDYIILTSPFEKIDDKNENFEILWKELEV